MLSAQFVLIDRRTKIASGQRTTSFSWLLNDKRGVIGRTMSSVPEQFREAAFMLGQLCKCSLPCDIFIRICLMRCALVYALVTELPAVYVLYDSSFWSAALLLGIFSVSVWNGGGFYIEVFGRKCVIFKLQFIRYLTHF